MRYQHDLRFVRMHTVDGLLHCERHGLLTEDEAADVLRRAGLTAEQVRSSDELGPLDRLREWWDQRRGPRCVPLATVIDVSRKLLH